MRYAVITSVDLASFDAEGNPATIPAGTVVNVILWDGITAYRPGPDLILVQSDTLQIGETYTP